MAGELGKGSNGGEGGDCGEGLLISTPPLERVPIITHLSAYRKEKVISAIKYELDHRGQGIYVLPRIKGSMIHEYII
ncbi:hypothetical protein CsSME_00008966 [Camellia sinensis var. sinensis]